MTCAKTAVDEPQAHRIAIASATLPRVFFLVCCITPPNVLPAAHFLLIPAAMTGTCLSIAMVKPGS